MNSAAVYVDTGNLGDVAAADTDVGQLAVFQALQLGISALVFSVQCPSLLGVFDEPLDAGDEVETGGGSVDDVCHVKVLTL